MLDPSGCQRLNIIGTHTLLQRARGRIEDGLGIKTGIKRLLRPPAARPHLGERARFREGQWLRVVDRERMKELLDERSRSRGLVFVPEQWGYCGGVYRVEKVVQRIVDDHGRFRPVSRTVLLAGVDCGGLSGSAGCGRHCPLMFREEWLEPAEAPEGAAASGPVEYVLVRSAEAIRATLDWQDKRDGLMFMPEMAAWTGQRMRVLRRVETVYEYDRYSAPPRPIYILAGASCCGSIYRAAGPCDRGCPILWHADWLEPAE